MMNKKYKEEMQEIHASEDLIKNTINKINSKNKRKSCEFVKKFALGAAAMMMVSVTSFATYIAVTGNTEILRKIGINISEKYEENKQEIKVQNTDTKFSGEKFDAEIVAISMDEGSVVAEINVKLKEEMELDEVMLHVSDFKVLSDTGEEYGIEYTIKQSSAKQEDGTYKCFVYTSVFNAATVGNGIETLFFDNEILPIEIEFSGIEGTKGNIIEENNWKFKINLNKQEEEEKDTPEVIWETSMIENIELINLGYQNSKFGNTIELIASQKDCNIDEINRIQKLDFVVKNENGEVVDIVSRVDNITMGGYKEGRMTEIGVEAKLVVDDTTKNPNYTIEIVDTDEIKVSKEKVQKINDEIIKEYQADDEWILTKDGIMVHIDELDETEYYEDDYGVNRTDLTYEEIEARPKG